MDTNLATINRILVAAVAGIALFGLGLSSALLLTADDAAPTAPAVDPADADVASPEPTPTPDPVATDSEPAPVPEPVDDAEPEPQPDPDPQSAPLDDLAAPSDDPTPEPAPIDDVASPTQCPGDGALPAGVEDHRLAGGDVDGDGDVDTIHGYRLDGTPTVRVSFSGGGGATLALPDADLRFPTQPEDGADLNGNGREEFFVSIGGGPKGLTYGVFRVLDCAIERIEFDGEAFAVSETDTVGSLVGFGCRDMDGNGANDFLVSYAMQPGDEGGYWGSVWEYALTDDGFELFAQGPIVYDPDADLPLTEWFPCDEEDA